MKEIIRFSKEEFERCEEFADMIKWKHPHFKDKRNNMKRSPEHIKQDVILGKLAEVAVQNYMKRHFESTISALDFNIYGDGVADDYDLKVGNQIIYIKSSKPGSSCLLIEKEKFQVNDKGLPITLEHKPFPDILVFVRVNYVDKASSIADIYAEVCGGICWEEFWAIKKFLPRGFNLNKQSAYDYLVQGIPLNQVQPPNRGIRLLADNYGIHIDQLRDISALVNHKLYVKV